MFDNLEIRKGYFIEDNITGNKIEVCTFNCTLGKDSGVYQNMNINYPKIYDLHKENILIAYREFTANISALAISMGLATLGVKDSKIEELGEVRIEVKDMIHSVMKDVLKSLENVSVNVVPEIDMRHY